MKCERVAWLPYHCTLLFIMVTYYITPIFLLQLILFWIKYKFLITKCYIKFYKTNQVFPKKIVYYSEPINDSIHQCACITLIILGYQQIQGTAINISA